jgi:hypothetical protein
MICSVCFVYSVVMHPELARWGGFCPPLGWHTYKHSLVQAMLGGALGRNKLERERFLG